MVVSCPTDTIITEHNYRPLVLALARARGFALFFVQSIPGLKTRRLIRNVKDLLERPVTDVYLEGEMEIYPVISEAAGNSAGDAVLFVYGLEYHLDTRDQKQAQQTLRNLSEGVAAYKRLAMPLVFWVPPFALNMIARGAPAFYICKNDVFCVVDNEYSIIHLAQPTEWVMPFSMVPRPTPAHRQEK